MTKRIVLPIAVLVACVIIDTASAHGLLRRLLSRPRVVCEPPTIAAPAKVEAPPPPALDTLEGRVTFKGELPKIQSLKDQIALHPDRVTLLKAPAEQLLDPTWRIDPKTRGIANVCVYLKRPENGKLPITEEDKSRRDSVVLDSPFGFYTPHMTAIYPAWHDGVQGGKTGQNFLLHNTGELPNDTRFIVRSKYNRDYGRLVPPRYPVELEFNAQPLPIMAASNLFPWARAYVWVFDHPYFAITKADGSFAIPRVPVGMEVRVQAWHEDVGWLLTPDGKAMTLQTGKNVLDLEITVPK